MGTSGNSRSRLRSVGLSPAPLAVVAEGDRRELERCCEEMYARRASRFSRWAVRTWFKSALWVSRSAAADDSTSAVLILRTVEGAS